MMKSRVFYVTQSLNEELSFLYAFVNQQEGQIDDYTREYKSKVTVIRKEDTTDINKENNSSISHIDGIAESDYDIESIFTEVMPAYQRQAMLVTIWSRIETKLDEIVSLLASNRKTKRIKKSGKSSDFRHLISELQRLGINFRSNKNVFDMISMLDNDVRKIRNSWVHNGGLPCTKSVRKNIIENQDLHLNNGIIYIEKDFLITVIDAMKTVANHIFNEATKKSTQKK